MMTRSRTTCRNGVVVTWGAMLIACSTATIVDVDGGAVDASALDSGIVLDSGSDAGALRWFTTCGDPVCRSPSDAGATPRPGMVACTTEREGDACTAAGSQCDPGGDCGALLRCATADPKLGLGGCPISSRKFKDDIRYLNARDLEHVASDVEKIRLATYTYKSDPSARERLGFIIEDDPTSAAVADSKTAVDLYGYTSMVIAGMKVQTQRLERQDAELTALRRKVNALERASKGCAKPSP